MASITFKPRTLKGNDSQIIYLTYRFGQNDKLVYSTQLKIIPANWNPKTMRARDKIECLDKDTINNRPNELQGVAETFITGLKANGKRVTMEVLKQFLDEYTNNTESDGNSIHEIYKSDIGATRRSVT